MCRPNMSNAVFRLESWRSGVPAKAYIIVTLCIRTKRSVRGPEDDYRCGQAVYIAAAVPDSPARLKVTARIIFIITIRRRHTIIHCMRSYNRERVPIRIDVGYIAVTCIIYYFFPIYVPRPRIFLRPSREVLHLWTGRVINAWPSPTPACLYTSADYIPTVVVRARNTYTYVPICIYVTLWRNIIYG